jgi:alanine racemase
MKFRTQLIVNLGKFKKNIETIFSNAPDNKIIFMVKADGYGHGVLPLVRFAYSDLGIQEFGCASLEEAKYLRRELSDLHFDIYVFSDIQLDNLESVECYSNERIFPVISSLEQLDYFLHQENFKYFPLCLKFNTGMNRLGIPLDKIPEVVKALNLHKRKSIYHLFSHLANSSLPMNENEHNLNQTKNFKILKEQIHLAQISVERSSISNSGAILQSSGLEETHIRPGIMGYTYPFCISKLETRILKTFIVNKDTPIGYNSISSPNDGIIAVLAIGYGDGFSTHYSGAHIEHKGIQGEIVGRINMDMTFVLFPLSAKDQITAGDNVVIWGEKEGDLFKFADETKTIPYELLCSLLPRIPRIYRLD